MASPNKHYDGSSEVEAFITEVNLNAAIKAFITKVNLNAAITGYEEEKKAQYLASQLAEGQALNVYLSLSNDEKKVVLVLKLLFAENSTLPIVIEKLL